MKDCSKRPYKNKYNICICENDELETPVVVCINIMELAIWMMGGTPGKEALNSIRNRVNQAVIAKGTIIVDHKKYRVRLLRI